MQKYIRSHMVEAKPMTRGDYNTYRGWTVPADENPADDGYLVQYPDGYVSWCPKAQFENAAILAENGLPYGYAMLLCRYFGKKIQRANWNGQGQYVVYQDCATLFPLTPEQRKELSPKPMIEATSACYVFHFVNRKTGETGIQVGWLASQADMAASDWVIVD